MISGTTESGFDFKIDEDAMNDMELLDDLTEMDATGSPFAISRVVGRIFPPEDKKRLYDHVRDENGKVRIEKVSELLVEILRASGETGKNS